MHRQPAPQPRELLPPLLACLPTAFLAPRPPPALLPLLSPLLRQRVNFLSANSTSARNDNGWLPLLSWDTEHAAKLPAVVERLELEPHPVSGELELDDVRAIKYRRLDEETLQSRLEVDQFGLLPVYLWCEQDAPAAASGEEGSGPGWKLADLRSLEDAEQQDDDSSTWFESLAEANDAADVAASTKTVVVPSEDEYFTQHARQQEPEEEDDGDYWAAYDRTPGRTPARTPAQKRSPAPFQSSQFGAGSQARPGVSREENDYYSRYGEEVQPALDSHDPDEADHPDVGESSLNGDSLVTARQEARTAPQRNGFDSINLPQRDDEQTPHYQEQRNEHPPSYYQQKSLYPADSAIATSTHSLHQQQQQQYHENLQQPRPISPTSSHSSVDRLEDVAREMEEDEEENVSGGNDLAQNAIKQHISTDVKSLFRLARGVGMNRRAFAKHVKRELELLSMMEDD